MIRISPVFRQCLLVIIMSLSGFGPGLCMSWSSPMLVKLADRNSTALSRPITEEEGTWIVSVVQITVIIAAILSPTLLNRVGRRNTILVSYVPKLAACLLLTCGQEVWQVILARLLEGASLCLVCVALSTYSAEIADKTLRGTLGSLTQISLSLGVVTMMIVGPFLSYRTLNMAYTGLMVVCFLPVMFLPESPYFLYSKGRIEESKKLLNTLRRTEEETEQELEMYEENMNAKQSSLCQAWKKKNFLKGFSIACFVGLASQFSGYNFVALYFQNMMESTKTVEPGFASMIFGLVQLCSCTIPAFTSDRLGRKPVLCVTLVLTGLGMAVLGTFFWWKESGHQIGQLMRYMPLLAMVLIIVGYNAGFGALVFILLPELFDGPERGLGVTLGFTCTSASAFVLTKCYSTLLTGLGAPATYWMFGCFCVLFCLFFAFCIPETKGKLFKEIQSELRNEIGDESKTAA